MNNSILSPILRRGTGVAAGLVLAFSVVAAITESTYAQDARLPASGSDVGQVPAGSVGGMGDVNLFPKRIVIDSRQRIATVGLYNKSTARGEYEIIISDKMMTPDGQLIELSTVENASDRARVKTASALLRWSPKRVLLPGSEAQTVRIMARVPPDLPPGEYRSHFTAISVPPAEDPVDLSSDEANPARAKSIGVRIVPRFGIAIPVFVRVGETTLSVSLSNVTLLNQPGVGRLLAVTVVREGTRSAFGDIAVYTASSRKPIAELKGVGVYPEVNSRTVYAAIDPNVDPRALMSGAKLSITFTDDDNAPGQVLARQTITVP